MIIIIGFMILVAIICIYKSYKTYTEDEAILKGFYAGNFNDEEDNYENSRS